MLHLLRIVFFVILEIPMSVTIRIDQSIYDAAAKTAKAECRTISHQIEYWAKIGKAALDNPDLPVDFIRDILVARSQDPSLAEPFNFEG
jgi:hypothetical protein